MLTLIEAAPLVEELRALKRFPREPAAVKAIGKLLANHARDGQHGERIVASLLEMNSEWPGPSAIVETARRCSDAETRERSVAGSQMARWREDYKRDVEPWLCTDCSGLGILLTASGRIEACGCPEGRPKWVSPDGKPCPSWETGAVLYMGDEWLDRLNANLAKKGAQAPYVKAPRGEKPGLGIVGMLAKRAPASQPAAPETPSAADGSNG